MQTLFLFSRFGHPRFNLALEGTYSLGMASCMQTLSFFTLATLDLILLEGIISVPLVFLGTTLPWIEYILLPFGRTWPLDRHI